MFLVHQLAVGLDEVWLSSGPHQVECPQAFRLASLYQACSFIKVLASSDPAHREWAPGNKDRHTHGSHRSVWLFVTCAFDSLIGHIWIRARRRVVLFFIKHV